MKSQLLKKHAEDDTNLQFIKLKIISIRTAIIFMRSQLYVKKGIFLFFTHTRKRKR